jgi:hypothetical protein
MRNLLLIAGLAGLLAACQGKNEAAQNSLPGKYANFAKSDYSVANDTLVITKVADNAYQIVRQTTYQIIRDGKLLPKHKDVENIDANYDPKTQELNDLTKGRIYHFDPATHQLKLHQAIYHSVTK